MKLPKIEVEDRTTREWLLGSYDYKYLCMPQWPFGRKKRDPPKFFEVNAWLGFLTAAVMGLQHALAMIGGLIVPATIVGSYTAADVARGTMTPAEAQDIKQYLISASLIICGITTMIQVTSVPLPYGRQLGAGILSVMGVSFTTVPVAQSVLGKLTSEGQSFNEAYGKLLGTIALCGLIPLIISSLPHKAIRKVFPPIVCGVTIMLIGINLAGAGMSNWGGGTFCGQNYKGLDASPLGTCQVLNTTTNTWSETQVCYGPKIFPLSCDGNGNVKLPFGSPVYVGLGFASFSMLVIIELFGSPFLRNCSVIVALLFGYFLAAVTRHDGKAFVTTQAMDAAPGITFLWTTTFPLSLYGAAVIPMCIVFTITSIETVGDVTATEEASFLNTSGPSHQKRIKGALLNDGLSGIFSGLATSLPLTTFAQNNGVISLTAVASRQAGWACACWLFLFGIIGKIGAFFTSIPNCVLGGVTFFLFANVIASGVKIVSSEHLNRRNRFIMACALGLGIGVTIYPQWADWGSAPPYNAYGLWPCTGCSSFVKSLRDALILILSSGLTIGAVTACFLNLLLPAEKAMIVPEPSRMLPTLGAEPTVYYKGQDEPSDDSHSGQKVIAEPVEAPRMDSMTKEEQA
ncbi:hypothetical protein N2152v2_002900 [Parachlorella kessleri]